jgi:hypothetical protein
VTYVLERPEGFVWRGMLEADESFEETAARACDVALSRGGWGKYRITVDFGAKGDCPHVHVAVFLSWWRSWRFAVQQRALIREVLAMLASLVRGADFPSEVRFVAERKPPKRLL